MIRKEGNIYVNSNLKIVCLLLSVNLCDIFNFKVIIKCLIIIKKNRIFQRIQLEFIKFQSEFNLNERYLEYKQQQLLLAIENLINNFQLLIIYLMISLTNAGLSYSNTAATFADLINQTKRIFEIIRLRRSMITRNTNSEAFKVLKQEHQTLSQEQDVIIEKYAIIERSTWETLRSFFIRFRLRLAELEQRHTSKENTNVENDFMRGLDQLIQELLRSPSIELSKFFSYVFGHYRQSVDKHINSLIPATPLSSASSHSSSTANDSAYQCSPMKYWLSPQSVPSMILPCNNQLHRTWMNEGKVNYSPLDIDPSLKEIYFFTRDKADNAELMYEEMMDRNKFIQGCIRNYKKDYEKFQKQKRVRYSQSQRIKNRKGVHTNKKETASNMLFQARIDTQTKFKSPIEKERRIKTSFGMTMFRIRPSMPQKSFRLNERESPLKQDTFNLPKTPIRRFKRPSTIKIQFKNISHNNVHSYNHF